MGSIGSSKFVSQKVSAVRWQPSPDTASMGGNVLATGSWDDEKNTVTIWRSDGNGMKEAGKASHTGDVTRIEWNGPDLLLATSSSGQLTAYKPGQGEGGMQEIQAWPGLHRAGAGGCTGLAIYGDSVATAGQDGRINVLAGGNREPVKVYDKGDSCSIMALSYTRANELVSANMRGQLKSWDLRSNSREPVSTSCHGSGVTCLGRHPTQAHILVSGGSDGILAVWDLRTAAQPTTLLSAHQAPLSEVTFHPSQPDHMFTCSQGGDVCHWNGASIRRTSAGLDCLGSLGDNLNTSSPWLSSEAVKHKVETHSLVTKQPLPVNSIDVVGHSVVFGGDNEAFYVLHNVIF